MEKYLKKKQEEMKKKRIPYVDIPKIPDVNEKRFKLLMEAGITPDFAQSPQDVSTFEGRLNLLPFTYLI